VNIEHLARVVFADDKNGKLRAYPDTLVGTDSHTTMVNGLGVLGWGVGGIEAEAAMLGQPVTMLIPQVIGFRLKGALPAGATATDLVLTVTEMLRKKGVVDKFVEFFGTAWPRCRSPTARRSPTCRRNSAAPAQFSRSTRRRCVTSSSPPQCRAAGARRGVCQGAGSLAHERDARGGLHRRARARSRHRRAEPRRSEASQDRVPLRSSKEIYRKHLAKMARSARRRTPVRPARRRPSRAARALRSPTARC